MNIDEAVLMPENKPINFRPRPRSEVNLSYSVQVSFTTMVVMDLVVMILVMVVVMILVMILDSDITRVPLICILVIHGRTNSWAVEFFLNLS